MFGFAGHTRVDQRISNHWLGRAWLLHNAALCLVFLMTVSFSLLSFASFLALALSFTRLALQFLGRLGTFNWAVRTVLI